MTLNSLNDWPTYTELASFTTLADWVRFCASQMERSDCFYGHGFTTPWHEARHLVLRGLQLDWDVPDSALSAVLLEHERALLFRLIHDRCVSKIPTAYLLEEAWFFNEPFRVDSNVLIPRSPIGELVSNKFAPWLQHEPTHLLDLCTGSGCIGIAMARTFPQAHVDISDLSAEALDIAIENIGLKDLDYQIDAYQGDLFEALPAQHYDLIVSNPPYVDADDIDQMPAEFLHEPRMGLAAGDDGLDLVRKILAQAPDYLTPEGWLICEVGNSAAALIATFPDVPFEWPDFSQGGHGVLVISSVELTKHAASFH